MLIVGRFGSTCAICDATNLGRPLWIGAAGLAIVALFVLFVRTRRAWVWLLASIAVLGIAIVRTPLRLPEECTARSGVVPFKIIAFNVWEDNRRSDATASWILGQGADAVVLVEAKRRTAAIPAQLREAFPYQSACLARLPCSTYILLRNPPLATEPLGRGDVENRQGLSAVVARIMVEGHEATLVAVHLSRPLPFGRQQSELAQLADRVARYDNGGLIVAGDFNATLDSHAVRDFATRLDLAPAVHGVTWPTPARPAGLPGILQLDHQLIGADWQVRTGAVGPVIGSDHRPTLISLCRRSGTRFERR